jgi:hypothetical protein
MTQSDDVKKKRGSYAAQNARFLFQLPGIAWFSFFAKQLASSKLYNGKTNESKQLVGSAPITQRATMWTDQTMLCH